MARRSIRHSSWRLDECWSCDRVDLLQHGMITFGKPGKDTSVQELNDIVIEEYRRALEERRHSA